MAQSAERIKPERSDDSGRKKAGCKRQSLDQPGQGTLKRLEAGLLKTSGGIYLAFGCTAAAEER
jgi:hypothetical protein